MKLEDIYKKIDALNEAVSMNISMSGDNAQDVGDLFNMMRGEQPKAEPIKMLPPRDDIEKSLSIIDRPGPMDKDQLKPGIQDKPCPICGKNHLGNSGCGEAVDDEEVPVEEWDNEPDEEYQDTKYMTKDLSGGLNRQKKSYPKVAGGDNPMALEDKIKEELSARLAEIMKPAINEGCGCNNDGKCECDSGCEDCNCKS
jgi:hypothetical protein